MITLKDYAAQSGITYEAVRQSVKRYQAELEGHITKIHRTQYLDDYAVSFLDEHRAQNPVVLYTEATVRRVRELEEANRNLNDDNASLLRELRELDKWRADKALELAAAEQTRLQLTAAEQDRRALEASVADANAQIAVLSGEKAQAEEKARLVAEDAQRARDELTAVQAELAERRAHPWKYLFRKRGD